MSFHVLEEELKNRIGEKYFKKFDYKSILQKVDFAVSYKQSVNSLLPRQYILWAEAKAGTNSDINKSIIQLILTIGREKTFEKHLPPKFLGAFDAEKILFIEYHEIQPVFYTNDFNWTVAASDYDTESFKKLEVIVNGMDIHRYLFHYEEHNTELKAFIQSNFSDTTTVSQIEITRNNFVFIYQDWLKSVKPSIGVLWDKLKLKGILDADFFLADVLSADNHSVGIMNNLRVLLDGDTYLLDCKVEDGLFEGKRASFRDGNTTAHRTFWNIYKRPPHESERQAIVDRRDLLVPQDIRERKGSFFTPQIWARKSKEYLAQVLGENWQEEYYIWDCCAGTGNLLYGLTHPERIWASTLDPADVRVMKELSEQGKNNLYGDNIFQFDFLNDSFDSLPVGLREIIGDKDKRKKLVVYINPPYAEAGNAKMPMGTGKSKDGVARGNNVVLRYKQELGKASNEVFVQFFMRIYKEIEGCVLGTFGTLKTLVSSNFAVFRSTFDVCLERLFLVPADTFDNVQGQFPIGFFVWDTRISRDRSMACPNKGAVLGQAEGLSLQNHQIIADVFGSDGKPYEDQPTKTFTLQVEWKYINDWMKQIPIQPQNEIIGYLEIQSADFLHNQYIYISLIPSPQHVFHFPICRTNLLVACVYFAVRHCIVHTWLNNQDQFLYPNDGWQKDIEFQTDCLVYTLFHGKNYIQSSQGVNHWIPFTEEEIGNHKAAFESRFMSGVLGQAEGLSLQARAVLDAGREIWKYYFTQANINVNASFYDIRQYFQGVNDKGKMNSKSEDTHYMSLLDVLKEVQKVLARKIEEKVYTYGFLV